MKQQVFSGDLFKGQVAVVTGGGSGIGLETALSLAKSGSRVAVLGRNENRLAEACEEVAATGPGCDYFLCDIRDPGQVESAVGKIVTQFGSIDMLVNNAGGQFPSPAEKITAKGWNAVIDTNLNGTFYMCREVFLQAMKPAKGGRIVNVVANMWNGFPMMSHTGASRAGVVNLTRTLALEWGRYGIRVNAVAPGIIETGALGNYDPATRSMIDKAKYFNQMSRLGTTQEVAAGIIFLLSDGAGFTTGDCLKIDGGESLYSPLYPPHRPEYPESR